jgi:hypothetical protein
VSPASPCSSDCTCCWSPPLKPQVIKTNWNLLPLKLLKDLLDEAVAMLCLEFLLLFLKVCLEGGISGHVSGELPLEVGEQGVCLTGLAEVLTDLEVACLGRVVQGVVALAIFDVYEGLRELCEKVHHLEVTLLTRQVEGSRTSLGAGVHFSHLLYQKLCHLHVVVKDCIM